MMTIYEYIKAKQPDVLTKLKQIGLLDEENLIQRSGEEEELTTAEIISLMRHDYWKRIRGAIRQMNTRRVIG
ncbi:hypothetical protein ciss_07240 [Carboxydothermus islandicus]|uniref:Uncharacterized protein n=1 Tax=Carboxydothermus islandicus TaxID=661089 RepID=A0A1L8D119_9THEO|nr:hypothetical protein [Carboxydothermus islandicus]GAV24791.1 hypothetical protein ciss_07240 [Carboxydothermus islandicus]